MEESKNLMLDIFLSLAFTGRDELPENKSSYAGYLYKWLELIEMCRVTGGGLVMTEDQQVKRISAVLADKDLSDAKTMIDNIKGSSCYFIEEFRCRRKVMTINPITATIFFDEKDQPVFSYNVARDPEKADERDVATVIWLNLMSQLRLEPERLQRCPKCGKYFYQHQRKTQKYCSRSCSDMGRSGRMFQFEIDSDDPSFEGRSYEKECPPRDPLYDGADENR